MLLSRFCLNARRKEGRKENFNLQKCECKLIALKKDPWGNILGYIFAINFSFWLHPASILNSNNLISTLFSIVVLSFCCLQLRTKSTVNLEEGNLTLDILLAILGQLLLQQSYATLCSTSLVILTQEYRFRLGCKQNLPLLMKMETISTRPVKSQF